MLEIDHIAVWTPDRDAALARISDATGLPVLEGYAPGGPWSARGVRFGNGPFLDVHRAPRPGDPFLGLKGDVAAAESLAARQGWRAKRTQAAEEPWTILSFGRGQGLLSRLFVIAYDAPETIAASPVFGGGLYHQPPSGGPELARVWMSAADLARAGADLEALGFRAGGEAASMHPPHAGRLYRGCAADLVLCEGEDGIVRVDISAQRPDARIPLGPALALVVAPEVAPGPAAA